MTNPDWATIASLATAGGTLVLAVSTFASVRSANRAARAAERSLLAGMRPLLMPSRLQDAEQKILFGDGKWVHVPGGGGAAEVAAAGEVGDLAPRGLFAAGSAGTDDGGSGSAGTDDGGPEDGGPEDGGLEDGGLEDGGLEDGGLHDGGLHDGGLDDAVYLAISLRNAGTGIAVVLGWRFSPRPLLGNDEHPSPEFRRQGRDLYIPAGDMGFWQAAFRDPADPQYAEAKKVVESRQSVTIDLLYGDHEGGQRMESRFNLLPVREGRWLASAGRHHNVDRPDPR